MKDKKILYMSIDVGLSETLKNFHKKFPKITDQAGSEYWGNCLDPIEDLKKQADLIRGQTGKIDEYFLEYQKGLINDLGNGTIGYKLPFFRTFPEEIRMRKLKRKFRKGRKKHAVRKGGLNEMDS